MEIKRSGSQPSSKGPAEYFTGRVRVDFPFEGTAPARIRGAVVTFEPGARTAWHTHPLGQTLIHAVAVAAEGAETGPVMEIRPGDIVWFGPARETLARGRCHHGHDPDCHCRRCCTARRSTGRTTRSQPRPGPVNALTTAKSPQKIVN